MTAREPCLVLIAFATALLPRSGHAQAFTQPKGEGRVITSVLVSSSDRIFGDDGDSERSPTYDKTEIYVQGEYGLTDDLTLLLTPSFRDVRIAGQSSSRGLGYTDIGARYRVYAKGSAVLSLQGIVRVPGQTRRDALAQIGQTDMEYDLRVQGGVSGRRGFAIVEAGYRFRAGDPADDFHLDATLGVRAAPRLWLIANSYNSFSNGSGRGIFRTSRYSNLFLSGAYELSRSVTLQGGGYGTWTGRNALRERGILVSVWFHYR